MRLADAAAFCGEAPSTFEDKVQAGRFPKWRWKEGGRVYWSSAELIEAMECDDAEQSSAAGDPHPRSLTRAQLREIELQRRAGQ